MFAKRLREWVNTTLRLEMWVTITIVIALLIVSLGVLKNHLAFGYQKWLGFKPVLSGFPCS